MQTTGVWSASLLTLFKVFDTIPVVVWLYKSTPTTTPLQNPALVPLHKVVAVSSYIRTFSGRKPKGKPYATPIEACPVTGLPELKQGEIFSLVITSWVR